MIESFIEYVKNCRCLNPENVDLESTMDQFIDSELEDISDQFMSYVKVDRHSLKDDLEGEFKDWVKFSGVGHLEVGFVLAELILTVLFNDAEIDPSSIAIGKDPKELYFEEGRIVLTNAGSARILYEYHIREWVLNEINDKLPNANIATLQDINHALNTGDKS